VLPSGGPASLNMFHLLSGSSTIGVCGSENYIPTELMSQSSFVQQNHMRLGNVGGATITPPPVYQILPPQTGGRISEDQISTINQDELAAESHPGFAKWLHLRAQNTSMNDKSLVVPQDWLTFGTNMACPGLAQTWHLPNSSAQILRDSDVHIGIPVDTNSRSLSTVNGGSLSFQQQPCWGIRERHQSQEEKHEQTDRNQDERKASPNASTSWGRIPAHMQLREPSNGRKPAFDKFAKFRFQEECIKLYGFRAPIHYAIKMNDSNRVRELLKKNNPNSFHRESGETPMHLACRLGKLPIVKILRRHPKINMNLRTKSGDKSVSPPGITAVCVAHYFRKLDIVNFLVHFKPEDYKRYTELTPLVLELHELSNEQEIIKEELDRLKPEIEALTKENAELEKKLRDLEVEDVCIMGKKLPRNKPTDNKKLADVLKIVRELESDLTALQERIWSEREDEKQCTICVERQGDTVLVPCGHFFCSICSHVVNQCPICRKRIERRIKTFR